MDINVFIFLNTKHFVIVRRLQEMSENHQQIPVKNDQLFNQTIDIIMSQTNVEDRLHVERVYMECENDVPQTVIKLMNLDVEKKPQKEPTIFEHIRKILNQKDTIYHDMMSRNKG
jgi:hypothetical protein